MADEHVHYTRVSKPISSTPHCTFLSFCIGLDFVTSP